VSDAPPFWKRLIRRLSCYRDGHAYYYVRTIYGEEVWLSRGKRSIWRCCICWHEHDSADPDRLDIAPPRRRSPPREQTT
jgi:hypothetical protein